MKTQFEILISSRTPDGFQACGQYFLGKNRVFSENVFSGLTGKEIISENAVIHIDLIEMAGEVPEKVKTISCKLDELCGNCGHITRELFRAHAIEPKYFWCYGWVGSAWESRSCWQARETLTNNSIDVIPERWKARLWLKRSTAAALVSCSRLISFKQAPVHSCKFISSTTAKLT